MKKSTYLCCLALLCLFCTVQAQNNNSVKPLTIGDKVPDLTIKNLLNYPTKEVTLQEFKGQWLIIDFWATWCSPCISSFAKMDSLEKTFNGEVQFLAVTYEDEGKVNKLFDKLKKLQGLKPLIATSDDQLRTLFPHTNLPHYVWVDPEGIVKAITGMEDINKDNIQRMVDDSAVSLEVKKDLTIAYDKDQPLLIGGNGGKGEDLKYHSLISGYIEGLSGGYRVSTVGEHKKITAINMMVPKLFALAYGGANQQYFGDNRIALETRDSAMFSPSFEGKIPREWWDNFTYGYELVIPLELSTRAHAIMVKDLKQFFRKYEVELITKRQPVLALVRTSDKAPFATKGEEPYSQFNSYGCTMRDRSLKQLVGYLNVIYLQNSPLPVVDATGYEQPVDLVLEANLSNVEELREALKAYDLNLVEQEHQMKILVIRDAAPTP